MRVNSPVPPGVRPGIMPGMDSASREPVPPGLERPPRRILVVRLGAIGDVVRTLPAVRLLRRTWPRARIAWLVEPPSLPLVSGHPDVDEVLLFPRGRIAGAARHLDPGFLSPLREFLDRLGSFRPDLSIDFQGSFKSGLLARLAGAPSRVAFDGPFSREGSHLFANHRVALPPDRVHRVLRAAWLARAAGARDGPLVADLALHADELARGLRERDRLAAGAPLVALAPFSSGRQAWKRWPLTRWTGVAARLAADGIRVVVVAGPGEEDDAARLAADAGPGVTFPGTWTLRELAAVLAHADLFVGGDTGPMHIAWAAGCRVLAVYGPTDPALNAPFGEGHRVLAPPSPTNRWSPDPFPGITPGRVAAEARAMLEDAPAAGRQGEPR